MILPYLRENLELIRGNAQEDGSPSWLIYDALRNKYFAVGLTSFRLIRYWQGGKQEESFFEVLKKKGLEISTEEFQRFKNFLINNNLIIQSSHQGINQLVLQKNKIKKSWLLQLIYSYLFFRLPLVRPDQWLHRTLPYVTIFASKLLRYSIYILGAFGIYALTQQWESFWQTFMYFFSWQGLFLYGLAIIVVKSLHELGHAYVAKYYGCSVSSMGIAFLVCIPILYTDTTDAWKLRNHHERLLINFAGIVTELHLALIATFVWSVMPDGTFKSIAFFIATTSWITSLSVNLTPFMRFDGYYILSDWLKADNLQPRSFELARWKIRELLFGMHNAPPELLTSSKQWIFIIYAWFTWIYRFLLFLGIALLIYFFTFKVLGIILFTIEIAWFVALPIFREMFQWYKMKHRLKINIQTIRSLIILVLLGLLVFVPWKSSLKLPAVYTLNNNITLYSPYPAKVKAILAHKNTEVSKGDILLELESRELLQQIKTASIKRELLQTQLKRQNNISVNDILLLEQKLLSLETVLEGLYRLQSKLTIIAPIKGNVRDMANLSLDQWINNKDKLINIINSDTQSVIAFIPEEHLNKFTLDSVATFISSTGQHDAIHLRALAIDESAISKLPYPSLSSQHGGPIATREASGEASTYNPEKAYYKINFTPLDMKQNIKLQIPGFVHVAGKKHSLFDNFITYVAGIILQESGF